jgi:hypothetical protein
LSEQSEPVQPASEWASFEAIEQAGAASLAARIARGEIMTYVADGWVVREFPGGRIERLAPAAEFRAEDFPYPA